MVQDPARPARGVGRPRQAATRCSATCWRTPCGTAAVRSRSTYGPRPTSRGRRRPRRVERRCGRATRVDGIPEDQLAAVFTRFWRGRPPGRHRPRACTSCRGLVEAHGGASGRRARPPTAAPGSDLRCPSRRASLSAGPRQRPHGANPCRSVAASDSATRRPRRPRAAINPGKRHHVRTEQVRTTRSRSRPAARGGRRGRRDEALRRVRGREPPRRAAGQAQIAHAGDRAPLALANREIGALPPAAKAEAGKRVGAGPRRGQRRARRAPAGRARGRARRAGPGRGGGRRHAAVGPRPARRPAPADHDPGADRATSSSRWAGRSPRAPRSRPSGSTSTR